MRRWVAAMCLAVAVAVVGCGEPTQRVGRQFTSMQQCLDFIEKDMGEPLTVQTDKPGDVSGKGKVSGRFFRCELKMTGTQGPVLEGRWDRPK